jgi:molybdopterin-guanine dinucleotide biosynthesis protein A
VGAPARHLAVLAGGRGSRIGGDKAMTTLRGRPLIDHVLAAGEAAGLQLVVVAKAGTSLPEDLEARGVRVFVEADQPVHPLHGIVVALRELDAPVVAAACDMPLVTGELLGRLSEGSDEPIVAPRVAGRLQPMLAHYNPAALPELEAALQSEESAIAAIERAGVHELLDEDLRRFGDPERLLLSCDTPEQLAQLNDQP